MTGSLKELTDGHIRIADTLVDNDALFGEGSFILLWYRIGMMTAGGEHSCHEGLLHLRHLRGIVL